MFWPGESKPVFFVASRGHHADIGGITPGSMPPHSKCIQEEGAVFKSFKLVDQGIFQEEGNNQKFNAHLSACKCVFHSHVYLKPKYLLLFFNMFARVIKIFMIDQVLIIFINPQGSISF